MKIEWRLAWVPAMWALFIACAVGLTRLGFYGATLFVFLPSMMGALLTSTRPPATSREAFWQGAASAIVGCVFFLLLGLEGVICMVMALPLAIPLGILGSAIAYRVQQNGASRHLASLLLLPFGLGSAGYDAVVAPRTYEVTTTIEIAAPPQTVWSHVIAYADMPEPTGVFRSGLGYPRRVRMEGTGVGATRYCDFSTGSFVEPITVWEPGRRLEFDVVENPPPMKEWSPYGDIQTAHLHNYYVSKKGRFVLTALSNGHTRVDGTSWYQHNLEPGGYWRWWSDAIIHRIHTRVLTHIKVLSEV